MGSTTLTGGSPKDGNSGDFPENAASTSDQNQEETKRSKVFHPTLDHLPSRRHLSTRTWLGGCAALRINMEHRNFLPRSLLGLHLDQKPALVQPDAVIRPLDLDYLASAQDHGSHEIRGRQGDLRSFADLLRHGMLSFC